jgi:hypothetical protein
MFHYNAEAKTVSSIRIVDRYWKRTVKTGRCAFSVRVTELQTGTGIKLHTAILLQVEQNCSQVKVQVNPSL